MKKQITELIRNTIYILMGIQIALGIAWIVGNLIQIPRFVESQELLEMSASLRVDEYTGFLYPLFIYALSFVTEFIKIPACTVLYVVQLLIAYYSYGYFFEKVVFYDQRSSKKFRNKVRFYTLYCITLPIVLQVHMAVLAYSMASSLMLLLLAWMIQLCRNEGKLKKKDVIKIALLWIVCALICVDYAWLAGIPVVVGVIFYMARQKKAVWSLVIMIVAAVLGINILNTTLQTPGCTGKIQKSWEASMLTRVVWPNFSRFSYFWKGEIRDKWDDAGLLALSSYPEMVIYEFGPTIDEMFGYEEANNIYKEMIGRTFELDTKRIVMKMAEDAGAYLCPPLTSYVQLQGNGSSYTGWNYGRMKDYTPIRTKYFVEYALSAWIFILLAGVLLAVLKWKPKEWKPEKERLTQRWMLAYLSLAVIVTDIWYVLMSGHMQDYKKVLVNTVLCTMFILAMLGKQEKGEPKN